MRHHDANPFYCLTSSVCPWASTMMARRNTALVIQPSRLRAAAKLPCRHDKALFRRENAPFDKDEPDFVSHEPLFSASPISFGFFPSAPPIPRRRDLPHKQVKGLLNGRWCIEMAVPNTAKSHRAFDTNENAFFPLWHSLGLCPQFPDDVGDGCCAG